MLLRHYLGEPVDAALEQKIAVYLRRIQGAHGGWPLFRDGEFDMSATVKAYFALKMIGDAPQAPHMHRAREAIRLRGGAERANVFTRCLLALYGIVPWRAVPEMPVEIMLLPKWFPFHLDKISYWSRTVIVPLLVLMAKKPRAVNAKGVTIDELFLEPPRSLGPTPKAPQQKASWFWFFRGVDNVLRAAEPLFPKRTRARAIDRAVAWVGERLNGEDGLGAIFPAMANSVMMYAALGYPEDHPQRAIARQSVEKLLVVHDDEAYCQPCVSPIWDTGLACHALLEAGGERVAATGQARPRLARADAGARRARRLDRAAARAAARRLGLPICQSALSRRRRHRGGGDGDGPLARHDAAARRYPRSRRRITTPRSRARANGSSACRARTAPGARSMPTTNIIISTIFRSPITARCSIRRPRTSPRAACRCWRNWATRKARR